MATLLSYKLLLLCTIIPNAITFAPQLELDNRSGSWLDGSTEAILTNDAIADFINRNIQPQNIRSNLRLLTRKPHLAGTAAELETAQWVADTWREYGLDDVNMADYEVLLSYPDAHKPNIVRLLNSSNGDILHESAAKQMPLYASEESRDDVPFTFNAYAAPGHVEGSVIYVNYGRSEDFRYLENFGMNFTGKIVLARYGMIFRSNIASFAEERGAIGVLLYTDPADYAILGESSVYPDTVMMPPTGTQQGTVKLREGDPLTPFYPSIESAFRIPEEEAPIPKIPVQPLSYEDASFVINFLGGAEAPAEWQGGLNLTYRIGPTNPDYRVSLDVHTSNQPATIHNVIGVIRGSEEPDRYVLVGNHRDAWIFGAIDPSSGTAAMMELSRVLMQLHNETGWRPRRSLVLCSWAAEEYGLVGSIEWTEQFGKQLQDRAVAYLNVDVAITGNYTFTAQSAPLLYDVVWNASKMVPNPDPAEVAAGRDTVYDTWLLRTPDQTDASIPQIGLIGASSDYTGFLHNLGVPSLNAYYDHDESITGWYPLYHSLYETFELVDELYDSGFLFQGALTSVWAIVAVTLADAQILPFSLDRYSTFITTSQQQIAADYEALMTANNRSFDFFLAAGNAFTQSVSTFQDNLPLVDTGNPLAVRHVNDQQMMVERAFIDNRGLPGRPQYNHVVMAPSASDSYTGTAFSGLTDALWALSNDDPSPEEEKQLWLNLDQHLAAVTFLLHTAADVLTDTLW